ncbi:MAG: BlaI/MecI/CopY family transcriptional regulator [Chloroflexota bacterium]
MHHERVTQLERALGLVGPLEGRIMRAIWTGAVPELFVVRDILTLMPESAYTTLMTTLNRLAGKGMLKVDHIEHKRAHVYRATGGPEDFLAHASREQVKSVVERFGEAAMVAFAERLNDLSPEQRDHLRELGQR